MVDLNALARQMGMDYSQETGKETDIRVHVVETDEDQEEECDCTPCTGDYWEALD